MAAIAKPLMLFIVGPTASGKSDLAMYAAKRYSGEIICADSQTVHKRLDIGTAKPSAQDQAEARHHLLDIIGPYETYNVAQFKEAAEAAITDIAAHGKLPIIVGGTGLYIDALYYQYNMPAQVNLERRKELEAMSVDGLQRIIAESGYTMPENDQNSRHLVGTILRAGETAADTKPRSGAVMVGILPDDDVLKMRIDARVEHMFDGGFVDEVRQLVSDYGVPEQKMDAIGYPIAVQYLDGNLSLEDAKNLFKRGDWQYARRQKAWFKRNKSIQWVSTPEQGRDLVDVILSGR